MTTTCSSHHPHHYHYRKFVSSWEWMAANAKKREWKYYLVYEGILVSMLATIYSLRTRNWFFRTEYGVPWYHTFYSPLRDKEVKVHGDGECRKTKQNKTKSPSVKKIIHNGDIDTSIYHFEAVTLVPSNGTTSMYT